MILFLYVYYLVGDFELLYFYVVFGRINVDLGIKQPCFVLSLVYLAASVIPV